MQRLPSLPALLVTVALVAAGCGSSDTGTSDTPSSDEMVAEETTADSTETGSADNDTSTETTAGSADADTLAALFDDGALTETATIVDCTLANGSETTCYQVQVASLPATVDTEGPFCPATVDDLGGIWVWDGDDPGLYALDADFWAMMTEQGFDFVDEDGNVALNGGAGANSCLEQVQDGSFHLDVLLPTTPENLDEPTVISTISQVGLALDGVTIFGDAPSVADRGGLPALDACGGHIDPSGYYHWHFGAESIQANLDAADTGLTCDIAQDPEALVGFAFDGYPIYGPEENGAVPTDLDACSGHVGATDEFGETYHYHLSYESPNLPGCLVGATANGTLTSPDNPNASLPSGEGGAGGDRPDRGQPPTEESGA